MDRVRRDALLVVRAQLGDRQSLAELVGYWHEPLWQYVRRMLDRPGLADDVSQEAWVAALKALPGLKQPERFSAWIFTIARRSVMNHLRQKYREADPLEGDVPGGDDLAAALTRAQVAEGLARVPAPEREVLILFYLCDLPLEECAQILAIPPGTVKSRLSRARRLLHDDLIEKGYTA